MTDNQNAEAMSETMVESPAQASADNVVTLVDLQNVLVIMDLASSRGAFRGTELQPIGQLYNKINQFLQAALPKNPEETTEPTTGENA